MENNITREITSLTQNDCLTIFVNEKDSVEHPVHYHDEYELNLILNAKGGRRIIGDHIDTIDDYELVLVGPNQPHGWYNQKNVNCKVTEVTVQFHKDLFDMQFLNRKPLNFLKVMLDNSLRGILFSRITAECLLPEILLLKEKKSFASVLQLMNILHILSMSHDIKILSHKVALHNENDIDRIRQDKALYFMNTNYSRSITLEEVARIINISEVSLSRLIKTTTGFYFSDALDEIRISNASKMLIDSTHSVAEIAYKCGFNNLSHFNRLFKKKKHYQPTEFRLEYAVKSVFV